MSTRSIGERTERLEQAKARLSAQEARLKADRRKHRTRRLIEAGALVEKAGLLDLEAGALYGALLSLRSDTGDSARVEQWAREGGHAFAREARERDAGREPVTVTFAAPLPVDYTTRLRSLGLRWNTVLRHWEGLADNDAVTALAAEHDGAVRRVQADATP